jgi:hypothetical protein
LPDHGGGAAQGPVHRAVRGVQRCGAQRVVVACRDGHRMDPAIVCVSSRAPDCIRCTVTLNWESDGGETLRRRQFGLFGFGIVMEATTSAETLCPPWVRVAGDETGEAGSGQHTLRFVEVGRETSRDVARR